MEMLEISPLLSRCSGNNYRNRRTYHAGALQLSGIPLCTLDANCMTNVSRVSRQENGRCIHAMVIHRIESSFKYLFRIGVCERVLCLLCVGGVLPGHFSPLEGSFILLLDHLLMSSIG